MSDAATSSKNVLNNAYGSYIWLKCIALASYLINFLSCGCPLTVDFYGNDMVLKIVTEWL